MPSLHPALSFLGILLLGIGLDRWFSPAYPAPIPTVARIAAGAALMALSLVLALWGYLTLRRAGTPIEPGQVPKRLVTEGPFRFSRNPLYLAQLLFLAGLGLAAFPWLLAGAFAQALLLRQFVIPGEEQRIADHFGEAYGTYRQRVRRWL